MAAGVKRGRNGFVGPAGGAERRGRLSRRIAVGRALERGPTAPPQFDHGLDRLSEPPALTRAAGPLAGLAWWGAAAVKPSPGGFRPVSPC